MSKFIFMLSIVLTIQANGQNCPAGYEERTVKCNGQVVKKCVPINYTCHLCWTVQTPPCPSFKTGGTSLYNSYEKAYEMAEKGKNAALRAGSKYSCIGPDDRSYIIYLDDPKSCKTSIDANSTVINDLKNKIISFLERYLAEINNFKQLVNRYPVKPGAVITEYTSVIEKSLEGHRKLQSLSNTLTSENLSQIEQEFENIQNDETRLIQAETNYKNTVSNSTTSSNNTSITSTNSITNINQQKNTHLQNQVTAINQQYQTKQQNNEQLFNTLQTGTQNISDILAQNAQRKAEERQRQFELEQQRREQKRQEQIEEERKRQEEEDRINGEMTRQFSIDSVILSNNNLTAKTSSINPKIDSVYYIGYKRQYDEKQTTSVSLKVFVVYRYSDGTFPLFSNIVEKSKFENNINRYGITLLVGFFQSQIETFKALDDIQTNAKDLGINVIADRNIRKINFLTTSKTRDENFWNQ